MKTRAAEQEQMGLAPWTLALRDELMTGSMQLCHEFMIAGARVEVRQGTDALWALIYGPAGGFAVRLASSPGREIDVKLSRDTENTTNGYAKNGHSKNNGAKQEQEGLATLHMTSTLGQFTVRVVRPDPERAMLRFTVSLKPADHVQIPFWPRDLYPLDGKGNPANTDGIVHAGQRGMNTALLYLSLVKPRFGSLMYLQNLTALNDYFLATDSKPDGCVGGEWPELGYQLPPSSKPLPKGRDIVISDFFLHWTEEIPNTGSETGRLFMDLLAGVYEHLERPEAEYHNWISRAEETLRDLKHSRKVSVQQYGHRYIRPYTSAEYPDSMVQLAILWPLREYQAWLKKPIPLAKALAAGLRGFYDSKLGTLRRYLPSMERVEEKDEKEVDSWYLYHPLATLGHLALEGLEDQKDVSKLFLDSIDYAIKAARHFKYIWPVQFKIDTLKVVKGPRKPEEPGQSDVGGLYAFVMIQAYQLTRKQRFLREAEKAIEVMIQQREEFNTMYQANITAWGATACLWLFRITGKEIYREHSYMLLATFFHNTLLWQSKLGAAVHYPTFMGVTCLSDAPYMAAYEEFEAFVAFQEYLMKGRGDVPDSVSMLVSEYCKYALSRLWYYYPQELPKDVLATEIRNGEIDQKLAFPLEDLYGDGQPAGQVGQEVYGGGTAFKLVAYSYRQLNDAPFYLFCDYPVIDLIIDMKPPVNQQRVHFRVGGARLPSQVRLIPCSGRALPTVTVQQHGEAQTSEQALTRTYKPNSDNQIVFEAPAGSFVSIEW